MVPPGASRDYFVSRQNLAQVRRHAEKTQMLGDEQEGQDRQGALNPFISEYNT
jgi:hypothetical protein